jgi:hypothetical protein
MSTFVAIKTRLKSFKERKSPEKEDETIMEGCFWYVKPHVKIDPITQRRTFFGMNQKESQRLKELVKSNFFTPTMLSTIASMNDESNSKKQTRLRSFDWAVTNFTKGNPISYLKPAKNESNNKMIVDPHLSYSSELHSGHRLLFDPFRRGTHVYFEADGKNRHSTVGQLCFLKWCFDNGIDTYVDENADEIKKDMAIIYKKRRKNRSSTVKTEKNESLLSNIKLKRKRNESVDDKIGTSQKKRTRMELTPTPKSRIRGLVPMTNIEIHS